MPCTSKCRYRSNESSRAPYAGVRISCAYVGLTVVTIVAWKIPRAMKFTSPAGSSISRGASMPR